VHMVGAMLDITERKRAEAELIVAQQQYRELFESVGIAILRSTPEPQGAIIEANPAAFKIFEADSREQLLAVHPNDLFLDPRQRRWISDEILAKGQIKGMEVRYKTLKGKSIWGRFTSIKKISDDGKTYFDSTIEDITERKLAEEERARLATIVEQSEEAIIAKTMIGIITSWNTGAERMYGYSAQELIGKSISLLVPPNHPDDTAIILERVKNGEPVIHYETLRRKKDGGLINVTLTASPIKDTQNGLIGISIIGHDITQRKRVDEALQQANKQLNLLSTITRHDILNQLMALKMYLYLLNETVDKSTILTGYIQKIEQTADAIERQITFTRDYQELGVAAPEWQNVNESIQKAVAGLPMRDVRVELDPNNPEIFADRLFEKVFYNLIDNALRYGSADMKTIRVSSQEIDTGLWIVCEDDGVGITAEDKKRLFTRGFGKNTGLGLFLSREILAITGITIAETGEPGKGARFEIKVPKSAYRFS